MEKYPFYNVQKWILVPNCVCFKRTSVWHFRDTEGRSFVRYISLTGILLEMRSLRPQARPPESEPQEARPPSLHFNR